MKFMPLTRLLVSATLSTVLIYPGMASAAAPAPELHDDNPNGNFGDWYTGAVPLNASDDKPVLLFVQGLHSNYTTWYNNDGYYDAAYNAGYRTAFVQLKDADGAGGNMWTNGAELAKVIKKVAEYYGGSKINIIAHSKGGIDTQTALVHYDASRYVNVVHQLSTPNKGSELADLAYSSWAGWLADLIGMKDDAVYSLQTSYMANFRSQTDKLSGTNATKTYLSAGMGDDGLFSSSWIAHAFLPGEDDGAVTVESALGLPYGVKSFTKDISHKQMAKASYTWKLVEPHLKVDGTSSKSTKKNKHSHAITPELEKSSFILRGGRVKDTVTETFALESGIKQFSLDAMTSSKKTEVVLISPSGKRYKADTNKEKDLHQANIFSAAVHNVIEVEEPEAGEWTLKVEGSNDAYFMIGSIDGGEAVTVKGNKKVYKKKEKAKISIELGSSQIERPSLGKAKLTKAKNGKKISMVADPKLELDDNKLISNFTVPKEPGVYNLSFDVTGINENGETFTRSINYNFAVTDAKGKIE